jgi:hypothetical protein
MPCLSYTGKGQEEKKKKKAWPRSRRTNTRASQLIIIDWCQDNKLYKFDS